MQTLAILWSIRDLIDEPIALTDVGVARLIPIVVFSLFGGALADTMISRY